MIRRNILLNLRHSIIDGLAKARWIPTYTDIGFAIETPSESLLVEIDKLREMARSKLEKGSILPELAWTEQAYKNAVAVKSEWLASLPDADAPPLEEAASVLITGLGEQMQVVHDSLTPVVEAFCGQSLIKTMCYGPRLYRKGSVLMGHIDIYPTHLLGVSVPLWGGEWGLELADASMARTGRSDVVMKDREIICYEGCRMVHSRMEPSPHPEFVAAFFHWHPVDFSTGKPVGRGATGTEYAS